MTTKILSSLLKYRDLRKKNVAVMYRTTAISIIINEITGVIAVLIDGIITSRCLGVDVYSGISLVQPFSSVLLLIAGFFSTGCNLVSSRMIGAGKKKEANEAFSLAAFLTLGFSVLLILLSLCFPDTVSNLCGVNLSRHFELMDHFSGYLHGYIIGIPALMLVQIFGPILVMDNGKWRVTLSSVILCAVDIIGDLLNVFVFHGGAFGMGLATSVAYIAQLLILTLHFTKKGSYFRISLQVCRLVTLKELVRNGTPALIKKVSGTLRDISINYINIMFALSAVAIAARGIQNDLFLFLFCIPTGLGRTLVSMTGIYYSANNARGLRDIVSYAISFSTLLAGISSGITFVAAPLLAGLYTTDPEVLSLSVFSIRWMAVSLVFDTFIVLLQHFHQGADNLKRSNILGISERFVVPALSALILGLLFGSKGVLVSCAASKIITMIIILLSNCAYNHGIPKDWLQLMFLPKDFGGLKSDNMYAEIRTTEDAIQASKQAHEFCRKHHIDDTRAYFTSLCVEEMAVNVIERAEKNGLRNIRIDFRLFINGDTISMSLTDLGEQFDPTLIYEQHQQDTPMDHIGILTVTRIAKDIRYYTTFKSNNLLIRL